MCHFARYDNWEDGSTLPEVILAVWPASYVNYVPTNDLVLVSRFWKPGRSLETRLKDERAREVLTQLFPGREVVQVDPENVVRGGGGMNCITQQQPASTTFAQLCGWAKVRVDVPAARLYAGPAGPDTVGRVPRLSRSRGDVYLERLATSGTPVQVRVVGEIPLDGEIGWVEQAAIESAGEKCPAAYAPN